MDEELIGREPERAQLDAWVAEARAGRGSLVLLAGEAGVGKTALARLVLGGSGLTVLEGVAAERGASAYGPVIAALGRSIGRQPLLIVGAYRSDELPRPHPIRRMRGELRRARRLREIAVAPLDPEAAALLERVLGAVAAPSLRRAVFERTDGVPFFIEELGSALAAGRRLQQGSSGLELLEGKDLPLPGGRGRGTGRRGGAPAVGWRTRWSTPATITALRRPTRRPPASASPTRSSPRPSSAWPA